MAVKQRWKLLCTEVVAQLILFGIACGVAGAALGVSVNVSPAAHRIVGPLLCPGAEVSAGTYPAWRGGKVLALSCRGPDGQERRIEPDLVFLVFFAVLLLPSYVLVLLVVCRLGSRKARADSSFGPRLRG